MYNEENFLLFLKCTSTYLSIHVVFIVSKRRYSISVACASYKFLIKANRV